MRHRSEPAADSDSDLSISEDEDFDVGSSNYCVSLGGGNVLNHQEGIQVLFQLEKLRDTPKSVDGSVTTSVSKSNIQSKSKAVKVEDNANAQRFGNNFQFNRSAKNNFPCGIVDEEIISDDEDEDCAGLISSFNRGECPTSRCQKNELAELASQEFKEQLTATCFKSNEKKTISDYQRDIEERCWSPFPTDVYDTSPKVQNLAEKSESFLDNNAEHPSADELEDFDEQHGIQSVLVQSNMTTVPCGHVMQSFAECLDGLQDKTSLPREIYVPDKKRKKLSRGDIEREVVDSKFLDEVSLDPIGSESGSSGEESNYDDFKLHISHHDGTTMAECFQKILNSTSLANIDSLYSVQKPSSSGIFGQLQQVMQSQKDKDVEFLKMMRDGVFRGNIFDDVLILSRQLDAKLTVCQCSLKGNQGNPLSSEGAEAESPMTRERTIVFSPRVCSSVDLEIGNLIRIYSPWLEVRVRGNNQNMVLCTYYSQVSA